MQFYLVDDIWNLIKTYIFHDIKSQGKHLKNDKDIIIYNNILQKLPKPIISRLDNAISYLHKEKKDFITFTYYICVNKNIFIIIVETIPIPKNYHKFLQIYHYLIKFIYRNQYSMNKNTFNNTINQFNHFLLK